MKKILFLLLVVAASFGVGRSTAQVASNFNIRWTFTGVDTTAANDAEVRYLASAVMGSSVDADIYQRNADGSIQLDNVGRKKIAQAKVRPAFRQIIADQVAKWAESGDIGELGSIQVQAVTNTVKAQAKPAVQ